MKKAICFMQLAVIPKVLFESYGFVRAKNVVLLLGVLPHLVLANMLPENSYTTWL